MPQIEAQGAQVVGVSADVSTALNTFRKENNVKHLLLSDFPRRTMLRAYDALNTDEKSPTFGWARRAYFVIDKDGTVKYVKVMENALDLLSADDLVNAVKASKGA